jgi:hypothetical protein
MTAASCSTTSKSACQSRIECHLNSTYQKGADMAQGDDLCNL